MSVKKLLIIKCVTCQSEFNYYSSEFRPFCSERCKMVDLGHWLSESYAIPSQQPLNENDAAKVIEYHRQNGNLPDDDEEN